MLFRTSVQICHSTPTTRSYRRIGLKAFRSLPSLLSPEKTTAVQAAYTDDKTRAASVMRRDTEWPISAAIFMGGDADPAAPGVGVGGAIALLKQIANVT